MTTTTTDPTTSAATVAEILREPIKLSKKAKLHTVADEAGLDALPHVAPGDLVRVLADPRLLLHSKQGYYVRREDGYPWEHGIYQYRTTGGTLNRQPLGAFGDVHEAGVAAFWKEVRDAQAEG